MRAKAYKPVLFGLMALLAVSNTAFAQDVSDSSWHSSVNVSVKTKVKEKEFKHVMKELNRELNHSLKLVSNTITATVDNIGPTISMSLNNLGKNLDFTIDPKIDVNVGSGSSYSYSTSDGDEDDDNNTNHNQREKYKNYTKTYTLDGNDKIKLSNQYGKILVNTWDKREVKVDVQIKAEANSEEDTQKLLDGVQISDGKSGDWVTFKTEIERNMWNWGNKKRKLTINYTVFMPAKTDLDIEDSYGAIELPDMGGRVKLSTSYGSASVQSLASYNNDIEGSYGSLKVGSMNGGKLDFSYGSADIDECTNLKADLSYGSFKLGKLKGAGDFDLSYVGGFKIDELGGSLKKLNINTSYSGASVGLGASNFDFDITTSYGGFNYNDDKVTITSKTPPDGSRHIGTTRNYKGHVGKGTSDAKVTINTSYGGVHFD